MLCFWHTQHKRMQHATLFLPSSSFKWHCCCWNDIAQHSRTAQSKHRVAADAGSFSDLNIHTSWSHNCFNWRDRDRHDVTYRYNVYRIRHYIPKGTILAALAGHVHDIYSALYLFPEGNETFLLFTSCFWCKNQGSLSGAAEDLCCLVWDFELGVGRKADLE